MPVTDKSKDTLDTNSGGQSSATDTGAGKADDEDEAQTPVVGANATDPSLPPPPSTPAPLPPTTQAPNPPTQAPNPPPTQAPPPPPPQAPPQAPPQPPETREKKLKRIFVDEHKANKEREEQELQALANPGAPASPPPPPQAPGNGGGGSGAAGKFDKFMGAAGWGAEGLSDASEVVSDSLDVANAGKEDDDKKADSYGAISSTVAGGVGSLLSLYNLGKASHEHHANKKKGNRIEAKASGFDVASNVFGTLGSLGGLAGGICGLSNAGGKDHNDAVTGGISVGASALGAFGSMLGMIGNVGKKNDYARAGTDLGAMSAGVKDADMQSAATSVKDKKSALKSATTDADKKTKAEELIAARKQRASMKAKKYAASQASENAKVKSNEAGRAATSGGFEMLAGLGSVLGAGLKMGKSKGLQIAGLAVKTLSALGKHAAKAKGVADDAKTGKEKAGMKQKVIADFLPELDRKVQKIKDGEGKAEGVTLAEAKNIALARLGMEMDSISDTETPPDNDMLFKKISEKRLKYIKEASDKADILKNMGLEPTATDDAILEALGCD